jgi:hypothetical protein
VEGISIPSEKKMIQEKKKLSESHGTATASFSNGAYISDPLSFISTILPNQIGMYFFLEREMFKHSHVY